MTVDFTLQDKVASGASRYATGQTVIVDGGELILGPADRN